MTGRYKTRLCNTFTATGFCPEGLLCAYAHGASELRREAAVQQGAAHPLFKTALCNAFAG